MGHVEHEEVNSRLRWPQLGETRESADTFKRRPSKCCSSLTCSWKLNTTKSKRRENRKPILRPCLSLMFLALILTHGLLKPWQQNLHGDFFFCGFNIYLEEKGSVIVTLFQHTMYSEGAMNSIVAFWTSGLLCGSPYDLLTGLYINSSGTTHTQTNTHT